MRILRIAIAFLLLAAAVPGCGAPPTATLSYAENARRSYENAMQAFEDHDWTNAIPLFRRIRREFPYSRYAALSELRIADCELGQTHYIQAIRAYRSFVHHRPAHAEVPYASFKIAEAYYKQIPGDLFLSPPPQQRDQTPARSALRYLRRFVLDFPESEYIPRAREMITGALRMLALHELYAAEYYLARGYHQAAVNRLTLLLDEYDGSGVEAQALLRLGEVYLLMESPRDARVQFEDLLERYPDSGYAVQAREYLRRFSG